MSDPYRICWEYEVAVGSAEAFERFYGADGAWCRFFAGSPAWLGTSLFRDAAASGRYLTIDTWRSQAEYELFLGRNASSYETLDQQGGTWTVWERRLGVLR
jgi:hypothetical protein